MMSALGHPKSRCRKTKLYRRGCMTLKTRGEGIKNPIILWTSYVHCPQGRENSIEAPLDWMPYQLGIGMGNWPGKLQGALKYL